jgi:predicted MPP superfamily phosphohydrolase
MKVLCFSDLHIQARTSPWFLRRLRKKIEQLVPDLILFSGDVLTYAQPSPPDMVRTFFDGLTAPLGVFACYGNHDYAEYSTIDSSGKPVAGGSSAHPLVQGFRRLFGVRSGKARLVRDPLPINENLAKLYRECGVNVLHNETVRIGRGAHRINLAGLGDITAGHLYPEKAFHDWDIRLPGIVFGHSPDSYGFLRSFPGDIFVFGHTHGGQVNLPFIRDLITPVLDKSLKSGLYKRDGRRVLVTRGVGATFPFRLFAPPQIVLLELVRAGAIKSEAFSSSTLESASASMSFAASRAIVNEKCSEIREEIV